MSELNMTQDYSKRVGERIRSIRRQNAFRCRSRGIVEPRVQGVCARCLRARRAGDLGASSAAAEPLLQRARRSVAPRGCGSELRREPGDEGAAGLDDRSGRPAADPITIDLTQLASLSGPEAEMLTQYLTMIQVQRQDFNGRVLTVREQDRLALAAILGAGLDGVAARLEALGLSYQP